jgi:hypothetical protein
VTRRCCFLTLDSREKLDDRLANLGEIGAELLEDLSGDAFTFTNEAEEDVLSADVVVTELEGFAKRQFEDLLRPRCEWDMPTWRLGALADDLDDLAADRFETDPHALEGTGGDALTFVDEAKEDVFSADVVVVEEPSLFLSEDDDPSGPIGKPFKQGDTS